jgi:hypothetical protein
MLSSSTVRPASTSGDIVKQQSNARRKIREESVGSINRLLSRLEAAKAYVLALPGNRATSAFSTERICIQVLCVEDYKIWGSKSQVVLPLHFYYSSSN